MLNRSVLIVRPKQPFVDWINTADPEPDDDPHVFTLTEVNEDATAFLVEVEDEDELEKWLKKNWQPLFEEQLEGWYVDPELWPQARTLKMFREWCDFQLHTVVLDTGSTPLYDDENDELAPGTPST
jgi:hypothetical protein